jgi:aspartate aminotransferase-like enzyme
MKPRLLTPGPTPVPEETLLELARPVFYHRSSEFRALFAEVQQDLQYVFCTKNPVITLTASGTGGMEAAVSNSLAPGQKAILLICGRWGERWRNLCKAFGVEMVAVEAPYGEAVKAEQLQQALSKHPDAAAVFATHCETSTGVAGDIEAYGKLVGKTPAIFAVDAISGMGTMPLKCDAWGVDICVTGSQKALMLPPGLAFVSVSDKAWAKIDANKQSRTFYLDLKRYKAKLAEQDTPFTPANTLIRAQRASLKRIRTEGIENVWSRHARLATAARAGMTAMGLELFAQRPADGLTVVKVPDGVDGNGTLSKLEKKYGLKLANGQDDLKGKIWRLSHMGYCDPFDVLAGLSGLELVLFESGYGVEPGVGVAAAQKAFAEAVAKPQPAVVS